MTPRIIPDRDKTRNWYLDETFEHVLHNGDVIVPHKGYRFDGHSVLMAAKIFTGLAAITLYAQMYYAAIFFWLMVLLCYYLIKTAYKYNDIYAALVHDYLIDHEASLRYNRAFQDKEYAILMNKYSTGIRRFIMPKAVWLYGFLFFTLLGDYRGEPKPNTRIEVKVTHGEVV